MDPVYLLKVKIILEIIEAYYKYSRFFIAASTQKSKKHNSIKPTKINYIDKLNKKYFFCL